MKSKTTTKKTTVKVSPQKIARIKGRVLSYAKSWKTATMALRETVEEMKEAKLTRQQLIEWLVEGGFSKSWAAQVAMNVWHERNGGTKIKGRGNKVDPRAQTLLTYAVKKWGKDATKVLLSAYRLSTKKS